MLSSHGRVLVAIAREPSARLRDIADRVGLTERSAHRIVTELVDGGYVERTRSGTRNSYTIQPEAPIHDPLLGEHWIGEILAVVAGTDSFTERRSSGTRDRRRDGSHRPQAHTPPEPGD